jgi:branched-chain amino acid transport system substrate-binding protein
VPIQFYQIWEGERVLFYPELYATGEFQQPPWMK